MKLHRRAFLLGLAALPIATRAAAATPGARYLSCADDRARNHFVVGFDTAGHTIFSLPLPARGHGFALHPARAQAVVFARRPGSYFGVVDPGAGRMTAMISPPAARCFYGHGIFSADGETLYVCEHDDATGAGFIGVYDAARGYRRTGDFGAGGIGPHEVCLMPDGKTLIVGVGGIRTDSSRDKLNIDTMDPSLAYLDAASGRLLEQVRTPEKWHQLSIRHLDIDAEGQVAVAMQYEGDAGDAVPMAALHRRGGPLRFLRAPEEEEVRLRHYLGDIAFDAAGKTVASASPRGSVVALWDAASGDYLGMADASDGCGIVAARGGFLVSGGDGRLRSVTDKSMKPVAATTWMWDNHLLAL